MSFRFSAIWRPWRQSITNAIERWSDSGWRRAFLTHQWRQFRQDEGFQQAGVLSYTSLLALVPLMAVVLGVVSAFPVFKAWSETIQDFVFRNFVPAAGETVQEYVQQFVGNAQVLTGPGALFLVITSLLLMSNIEKAFNRIWRVETQRPVGSRMLVYWAMLTLGPMLLGGSLALTSVIVSWSNSEQFGYLSGAIGWLFRRTPFLVALVGFTLLYNVVPNRRVPLRYAFFGGLIAAILFESAKLGFVWYVSSFPTYEKLYGALAVVPIFLVWIYVTWLVTLLGAGLCAGLTSFRYEPRREVWDRRYDVIVAYLVLRHLWRAQCRGEGLLDNQLAGKLPVGAAQRMPEVLEILVQRHWVRRTEEDELVLGIDVDAMNLGKLYQLAPFCLPLYFTDADIDHQTARALTAALQDIHEDASANLERSLKSYFTAESEG
ncbi:MAG: YihY family inner membrane protein [Wenzhouxiangellaceae bacterium]